MTPSSANVTPLTPRPSTARRLRPMIFFVVGMMLVAAALWTAVGSSAGGSSRPMLINALDSARHHPWRLQYAAFALPLGNWLLVSAGFWILTSQYARPDRAKVGFSEMAALTGSAWLLNYLPFKAGLIGRVVYHHRVNGIAAVDSVRVLAVSIAAAGVATITLLASAIMVTPTWPGSLVGTAMLAPAVLVGVIAVVLFALRSRTALPAQPTTPPMGIVASWLHLKSWRVEPWRLAACLCFRYLDVLVWVARYAVVFTLIGHPLTLGQAAAIAGVSQVVLVIPFTGNALGLREWAVGLAASSLPAWFGSAVPGETATGLSADLVNRIAEVAGSVVVGLLCSAAVARRVAKHNSTQPGGTGVTRVPLRSTLP